MSTDTTLTTAKMTTINEESWVLTGGKIGGVWVGTRRWRSEGEPHAVGFPVQRVLKRHFRERDIIGFEHTHPTFPAIPSHLDITTMNAWVFTLGKPLICVIRGTDAIRGYLFKLDDTFTELMETVNFGWEKTVGFEEGSSDITIGMEHGRSVRARDRVSGKSRRPEAGQV